MAEKPIILAKTRAKNEQRLALIVPVSPIEAAFVSKFFPADPISTKIATACGIYPNLFICKTFELPCAQCSSKKTDLSTLFR